MTAEDLNRALTELVTRIRMFLTQIEADLARMEMARSRMKAEGPEERIFRLTRHTHHDTPGFPHRPA
jgi:hypothetical protein